MVTSRPVLQTFHFLVSLKGDCNTPMHVIYLLDARPGRPSSHVDIVKKLPTEPYPVTFRSNTPSPVEHGKHIDKYGELKIPII